MPRKNLTAADLQTIDDKCCELQELLVDAIEQIRKMHIDGPLPELVERAKTCAICAREASNLGVFLLMQQRMQDQRAEIDRLRSQ
jgi:hypothetical protein